MAEFSEKIGKYFDELETEAERCYRIADKARKKHRDPVDEVEIPRAKDLAMRVEKLLLQQGYPVEGVADEIRELSKELDNRELVAIEMAKRTAERLGKTLNTEEAVDTSIRIGLAVLTEGILVAPLEGIVGVKIRDNDDGTKYLSIYFAGPIRSAGGTGQALSVLIGDIVRRKLGISEYKPRDEEIERYKEEIPLYERAQHLQYKPSADEIEIIVRNCPVCIDGEGTEKEEVSGYRNLKRVETNRLRGGACLVIAEGMCLKASKIKKYVDSLNIDGWGFIDKYISEYGKAKSDEGRQVGPNYKFIKDVLAGRPVFSGPSAKGGFRLRYGRGRTTGIAAIAVNPATMYALDDFPALGTQIKIERPGKAGVITPCDAIEGPMVELRNGDFVQVNSGREMKKLRKDVKRIADVGEILIPFGEFLENNHPLMPASFSVEWWELEAEEKYGKIPENHMEWSSDEAFEFSKKYDVPLHPNFNFFWHEISIGDIEKLREYIAKNGEIDGEKLKIPKNSEIKEILIGLGALYKVKDNFYAVEKGRALSYSLGLKSTKNGIKGGKAPDAKDGLELVSKLSGVKIMAKAPTRIGARMGRPEKARERKMEPAPHVLFPLSTNGGSQRLVKEAARKGRIKVEVGIRRCSNEKCGKRTILPYCPVCGSPTIFEGRIKEQEMPIKELLSQAAENIGERIPDIKGVKGMISREKVPEILEKGILRAKHRVFVFKDGTCRFDMTDVPLTHFRPREIGIDVETAKSLGYIRDKDGRELEDEEQVLELMPQDIVVSVKAGEYLVNVSRFIDDELEKIYGLPRFYNAENARDLIGHLVVGLAPHTSGGVLARIIGYTKANIGMGHPYFHTAKRRNCDGDEDCIMLLLDGLLNFSRSFLPSSRGGLMDAPLVLTTKIKPAEIDKEAHNLDVMGRYPLEFYRATLKYANPKDVSDIMDHVKKRIGGPEQYEGLCFTHDTADISEGPLQSRYTVLKSIGDKINGQMSLAEKIDAVDAKYVVERIISTHFVRDIMGNMRAFATQKFRCTSCGAKYRRVPLSGKCDKCGGKLVLTVHQSSVEKYVEITRKLAAKYEISPYMAQRVEVLARNMESLFDNEETKLKSLDNFF